MEINIYSNYIVKSTGEFSYISDEDSLGPNDVAFRTDGYAREDKMNGGELINLIIKKLKDYNLSEFNIYPDENKIEFSYFNPMTGEGSNDEYIIELDKENLCEKM